MKKNIYVFLIILFAVFEGNKLSFAQQKIETSFQAAEGKVFIYYEFYGDSDKEYKVSTVLKRKSDPSFELAPSVLVGDVGVGKFANARRTIIWQLSPKEEEMLHGSDFYFLVTAEEVSTGGGIPWYVYAGGAALAGGAAAFFLLKKSSSNTPTTSTQFASPPGRPQ